MIFFQKEGREAEGREAEREGEGEGEGKGEVTWTRERSVVRSHTCPTGDGTHSLGMMCWDFAPTD